MGDLRVVTHPVLRHYLTQIRTAKTSRVAFRSAMRSVAALLFVAATEDMPVRARRVDTPVAQAEGVELDVGGLVFVPVLRAGLGLLDAMLELVPEARVGHIGIQRDEATLQPETYYNRLPERLDHSFVLVLDPMLATGGSACAALHTVKAAGAARVRMVSLIAAPEGVAAVQAAHPDVSIVTGALDEGLDARGFIVPGLGDAGDRLYGTDLG